MARIGRQHVDPRDLTGLARVVWRIIHEVDGQLSLGHPGDPAGPSSTTRASAAATNHSGVNENMLGAWWEVIVPTDGNLNTNITCYHNMGLDVPVSGEPNVRWQLMGWRHNGTGSGTNTSVSVGYIDGTVAANSIQLRVYADNLTVDAMNPLRVCVRLVPAERWY